MYVLVINNQVPIISCNNCNNSYILIITLYVNNRITKHIWDRFYVNYRFVRRYGHWVYLNMVFVVIKLRLIIVE